MVVESGPVFYCSMMQALRLPCFCPSALPGNAQGFFGKLRCPKYLSADRVGRPPRALQGVSATEYKGRAIQATLRVGTQ